MSPVDLLLADLAATAAGILLFPLVLVIPGYVVGWGADALGFRRASMARRGLMALLFSTAGMPIAVYLLARTGSFWPVWVALGVCWLAFPVLLARGGGGRELLSTLDANRWVLGVILAWTVLAEFMMVDLPVGDGLSQSILFIDFIKHVSVTDAITRTGVPPLNPSFQPEEPLVLFYYYFWFLVCSVVDRLGGDWVGPRHAVHAGVVWSGFILMAAVAVVLERLPGPNGRPPSRAVAMGLLLVTGLDLLPTVAFGVLFAATGLGPGIQPDLEWWNEQVSSWQAVMIWVPHHLTAFVGCMAGYLLLLNHAGDRWTPAKGVLVVLAGGAFASSAGSSAWVTLVAAAAFAGWGGLLLLERRWGEILGWTVAGAATVVMLAPFLVDMAGATRLDETPVALAIRDFWPLTKADLWYFRPDVHCGVVCALALLPLGYLLELGFFAVAAAYYWHWRRGQGPLGREERFLVLLAVVSALVATFVRADIHNNDLAWRGFLFAQFVLLVWSVPVAESVLSREGTLPGVDRAGRRLLAALLMLGVLGTIAQYARARVWPSLHEDLVARRTYEWLDSHLPRDSVTQHNPMLIAQRMQALYGHRQVAVADERFGWLYGVNDDLFLSVYYPVAGIFTENTTIEHVVETCRRFHIDVLVVDADDPVWSNPRSWVWTHQPYHENERTRVFRLSDLVGG